MDIAAVPCDDATRKQLRTLATRPPAGALLVIAGTGDLATVAARAFAEAAVRPGYESDVVIAAPDGDKWTVAEVDERIVKPSMLVPMDRTVLVVEAADMMDSLVADHLLKTVEEPTARTLFVFAVQATDKLLPTLRGRAAAVVHVIAADPRTRIAALVESGIERGTAVEIITLAGDLTAFDAVASTDHEVVSLLKAAFSTSIITSTPTQTGVDVAAAIAALALKAEPDVAPQSAEATAGTSRKQGRKVPDAVLKARTRTLARTVLSRWQDELGTMLRSPDLTANGFNQVVTGLKEIDLAYGAVSAYVPVGHVFAAVLAATNSTAHR